MSLLGLDSPDVVRTFTTSISEPAGWFLLNYVSRDTVELLGSGTSGVSGARTCMAAYEEKSPLYGLIMFRRKRVLIKYIPEGTSRLLIVRTNVHFNDIIEKYTPYDAILDISTVDGLCDTSLAATFPSHAAATAKRLDEITEDAEEPSTALAESITPSLNPAKKNRKAALSKLSAYKRSAPVVSSTHSPDEVPAAATLREPTSPTSSLAKDDGDLPPTIQPEDLDETVLRQDDVAQSGVRDDRTSTTAQSTALATRKAAASSNESLLTSSRAASLKARDPGISSLYGHTGSPSFDDVEIFDYRPKVKLGARPVQLTERKKSQPLPATARRTTALMRSSAWARSRSIGTTTVPTTTVPTNTALSTSSDKPDLTGDSSKESPTPQEVTQTVPSLLANNMDAPESPPIQSNSRPQSRSSFPSNRNLRPRTPLTPEKQRLLKAVELRRRQMRGSSRATSATAAPDLQPTSSAPVASVVGDKVVSTTPDSEPRASNLSAQSAKKSDSGIEMPRDMSRSPEPSAEEREQPPDPIDTPTLPLETVSNERANAKSEAQAAVNIDQDDMCSKSEAAAPPDPAKGSDLVNDASNQQGDDAALSDRGTEEDDPSQTMNPESCRAHDSAQQQVEAASLDEHKQAGNDESTSEISPVDDAMPPAAEQVETTMALDERNRTALYEDSVSTHPDPQPLGDFPDPGAEEPGLRNTWLSDADEAEDCISSQASTHPEQSDQSHRQCGFVAALAIPSTSPVVNGPGSMDSDFEYFGDATVHEAQSLQVLRSPATPVISRKPSVLGGRAPTKRSASGTTRPSVERIRTDPVDLTLATHDEPTRAFKPGMKRAKTSTNDLSIESPELVSEARRGQIGSSISERIAKLAESGSRSGSPLPSPKTLPSPPPTATSGRKLCSYRPDNSAPSDPSTNDHVLFAGIRSKDKDVQKTSESHAYYQVHTDPETRRQSVSVTARIVRAANRTYPEAPAALETSGMNEISVEPESARPLAIRQRSLASTVSRRSADSSMLKRFSFGRNKSSESRLSMVDYPSLAPPDLPVARPPSPLRAEVFTPTTPSKRERTSRFLKRMSGISSLSKRTAVQSLHAAAAVTPTPSSPTVSSHASHYEDKSAPGEPNFAIPSIEPSLKADLIDPSSPTSAPPGIRIGDVNVQFPGSGIWKRRFVEITHRGVLLFSVNSHSSLTSRVPMSLYNSSPTGPSAKGAKSWHLRSFRRVFVPHADEMELANSIVLELAGGGGDVVVAMEGRRGQKEVEAVLGRYWRAWRADDV